MDRGEGHASRFAHVDGALLSQVHVVEVNELELRLLFWPSHTNTTRVWLCKLTFKYKRHTTAAQIATLKWRLESQIWLENKIVVCAWLGENQHAKMLMLIIIMQCSCNRLIHQRRINCSED